MADVVTSGTENDTTYTAEDKQPNNKNDNVDNSNQTKDSEETPVIFALDENIRVVDISNIGKELETLNIENAKEKSSNSEKMDVDNEIITISEKITEQPKSTPPSAPPTAKKSTRSRDIIYTRPEDPLRTSPPPQCEEIIIDLDDDDEEEERRKRKRGRKIKTCCNFNCDYGENLINAPSFVLTYYQMKHVKGKPQKVCTKCFEAAISHNEHLYHVLSEHKPLLKLDFPTRTDTVIIQDSDSDDSDEDAPMVDTVIKDIEDKLMEVIDATQENYDLGFQLDESKTYLNSKISGLEAEFKEIDDLFNSLQKTIDRRRIELYEGYAAPVQELPPLMISDSNLFFNSSDSLRTPPSTPVYTSPSKRMVSSNVDGPRRSPITGVATKKVTQVQQSQRGMIGGSSVTEPSKEAAVEVLRQVEASEQPMLPPIGPLVRPRAVVGDLMYVMKQGYYGVWSRAKVLEVIPKSGEGGSTTYRIKFEYRKSNPVKIVTGRHMAYPQSCPVRFPVGTRVIALFRDEWPKECYYAGVIAEPPKSTNKYRYLVFFDDGYAQYVSHDKILLVCESSRNVWEDIHPESRDFVKNYLEEYPERPMVKLQQGQIVKTEWNGKWWIARVAEVDGSLVKMHFDADGRTEWIYRGSTRLGPLFAELAQAAARKNQSTFSRHRGLGISSLKKRNMPYVEYTRTDMEELKNEESGTTTIETDPSKQYPTPVRAVAKKSTTKRPESTTPERNDYIPTVDRTQPQGRIEYLQINTKACPKKFRPHQCGQLCMANLPHNLQDMKGYNPLVIPLLCGWQRHIVRYRGKRVVLYKAPCGRRLRNLEELHRYLRVTKSVMSVDQFDFDFWVHCFAEFILDDVKIFTNIKDLSYGAENVAVPCVNYVDHSLPDYVNYSTVRQPMEGVRLNTDPEFLPGCDCTDDCQDREKCSCWQLTIQGTAFGQQGSAIDPTVGYIYKRLPEAVVTGIYECNSRCKCASTCLNRVAQHPLQLRLQVFKTENRGWGIRCLNDIPQGCFICIYAGRLLTEQGANEGGKNYGDEYLAELDYIEVVERLKEGYESDVLDDEDSCSLKDPGNAALKESAPPDSLAQNDSGSDEEEDAELSQDAPDSDEEYKLSRTQKKTSTKHAEEGSIRSRLRKRAFQVDSEDSEDKDRDKFSVPDKEGDKESEKSSSDEKDLRKTEPFKKPFNTCPSDEFITLSDDEDESITPLREPSRFSAVTEIIKKEPDSKPKHRSVREFYGVEEYCYIMDAKNNGNIGRYLNHSCSPNVFVQNVFVDTHDLRFPWVAFFALTYIRAGTELTWDYNYDVGSVPGKVMYCHCGSTDCRGRLL